MTTQPPLTGLELREQVGRRRGISSWRRGEKEKSLRHLMDSMSNRTKLLGLLSTVRGIH